MPVNDQSETLAFLKDAASESSSGQPPGIVETHISTVLLHGDRAWKLKRALRLPYADFSTPSLRTHACERELELNRRTAPTIYLRVRRITRGPDGRLTFDGDGTLVDAIVEMRRFDENTLMSRMAAAGPLDRPLLSALAQRIADFHMKAQPRETRRGADNIAEVLALNEQSDTMDAIIGASDVQALRAAHRIELDRQRARLDARAEPGLIRRCHGDLHLRNICMVDGEPTLFDCIEFNDDLATIDVLYDLAFLLMDLWRVGLKAEANWVMNRYIDRTNDLDGLPLLPLFMSLRAAIRAQVLSTQAEVCDPGNRQQTVVAASTYFSIAQQLLAPNNARLLAIGGLSGSGKSTVAAAIAHLVGCAPGARIIATDRIRKHMAGVAPETALPPETYTAQSSERVYAEMEAQVSAVLGNRYSVLAEAVFLRAEERQSIEACAATAKVPFHGIWLRVTDDTLISRVQARHNDPSDADACVVRAQISKGHGQIDWTVVPAEAERHDTARTVLAAVIPCWSESPAGWDWLAQDEDGSWYWYAVEPQLGMAGGIWRSPRLKQRFAAQGPPNPLWYESCRHRP